MVTLHLQLHLYTCDQQSDHSDKQLDSYTTLQPARHNCHNAELHN
jgi:hypothetical protein